MFKNYLTYTFAQEFYLSCLTAEISEARKPRLRRSAESMIQHFTRCIQAKSFEEEKKTLFVALISLRDCKGILDEEPFAELGHMRERYEVLHGRFEQMAEELLDAEDRMQGAFHRRARGAER